MYNFQIRLYIRKTQLKMKLKGTIRNEIKTGILHSNSITGIIQKNMIKGKIKRTRK